MRFFYLYNIAENKSVPNEFEEVGQDHAVDAFGWGRNSFNII